MEEFYDWRAPFLGRAPKPFVHKLDHYISGRETLLDLGCGVGNECKYFSNRGLKVTGIDLSEKQIEICKERVPDGEFIKGDVVTIQLQRQFDIVWCNDVLEHLFPNEVEVTIDNAISHLKDDGILFLIWDSPKYRLSGRADILHGHRITYKSGYQPTDEIVELDRVLKVLNKNGMAIIQTGDESNRLFVFAEKKVVD